MSLKDRVFKRLSKKAKRGMRGWPLATIAYYGPDASRATKVVVEHHSQRVREPGEMRDRQIVHGDVRKKSKIGVEMLLFHGCPRREVGSHVRSPHGVPAPGGHRP